MVPSFIEIQNFIKLKIIKIEKGKKKDLNNIYLDNSIITIFLKLIIIDKID